ncbi:unnamed protein product, partial [marine sediment metagenome]
NPPVRGSTPCAATVQGSFDIFFILILPFYFYVISVYKTSKIEKYWMKEE